MTPIDSSSQPGGVTMLTRPTFPADSGTSNAYGSDGVIVSNSIVGSVAGADISPVWVGRVIEVNTGVQATNNINISQALDALIPVGAVIEFVNVGNNTFTFVVVGGGITINSAGGLMNSGPQWSACSLRKRAPNLYLLTGSLS